jgi:Branched-chain amino acid transport system / permease component
MIASGVASMSGATWIQFRGVGQATQRIVRRQRHYPSDSCTAGYCRGHDRAHCVQSIPDVREVAIEAEPYTTTRETRIRHPGSQRAARSCFSGSIVDPTREVGQQLRAMGQDPHVAAIAGIPVNRNRVIATVLSTVFASWGQLLFLQNIGTLNTYNSHEQVGMFAIAALLVSGATVSHATVGQALLGTVLFHTLFVVSPLAGKALAGDAQIGEYFRVFVAYAVITVALVLHAWQAARRARAVA